jgi:transcriptional regulator with XRE-family HTH domain
MSLSTYKWRSARLAGMTTGDLQHVLGRRLREIRMERDLSQEKLAEKLGFHRTYVGSIERGERNLSMQSLEELAELLGVRALDLLTEPS